MTERHTLACAAVLVGLLAGCPDDPAQPDGGPAGEVAIGTGGIGRYVPVEDGDTVLLARGCQGGQHLWIGLRTRGVDTEPALVSLSAIRVSDGAMVSIPVTVRLRFVQGDWDEITGVALVIPVADAVLDREIDLFARVAENTTGGQTVETRRRVTVAWGDEVCGSALPDGAVPRGDGGVLDAAPDADPGDGSVPDDAH